MKITKNMLKKLIKEEYDAVMEQEDDQDYERTPDFRDWSKEAEREGAPAQAKKMAALNNPEYGPQLHDLHQSLRGVVPGVTVPQLGQLLISLGNNYEAFATLMDVITDKAQGLDPDVVKNFLIDTGQSYQPGGEYLV